MVFKRKNKVSHTSESNVLEVEDAVCYQWQSKYYNKELKRIIIIIIKDM